MTDRLVLRRAAIAARIAIAAGLALCVTTQVTLSATARTAASHEPPCAIQYIYGSESCYAPADVARAEHRVPFALRPSAMVAQTMHLRLTQSIVWTEPAHSLRIEYVYGALPPAGNFNTLTAHPVSLDIRED